MKLLKTKVTGLTLFPNGLEVDFYAQQRVLPDKGETVFNLFSNIYSHNVMTFVGMNASGKTTTLKTLSFVLQLLDNKPINNIYCNDLLCESLKGHNGKVVFHNYFLGGGKYIYLIETTIQMREDETYFISAEKVWRKKSSSVKSKVKLFDFSDANLFQTRTFEEEYLLDDVSLVIGINKKEKNDAYNVDLISLTDQNLMHLIGYYPDEIVTFLDPNIESLKTKVKDEKITFSLKFRGRETITLHSPSELENYLSSGTIKGIHVYITAIMVLKTGGYCIIDELENHFHKEIVHTLIQFFQDTELNSKGATLVFSTHYPELLDLLERNDSIYVVTNQSGIAVRNLAQLDIRDDLKKSDVFFSDCLGNTAPAYETYIELKGKIKNLIPASGLEPEVVDGI